MKKVLTAFLYSFFVILSVSGCSDHSSSQNPYAHLCNKFVSGTRLVSLSPGQGTQFGDQRVTAVINGVDASFTPATIFLGNKARGITITSQSSSALSVGFTTAGTPTAGTYPLVIEDSSGNCIYAANAYAYTPPVSSAFRTFVGFGASGTAGFQSDSYNEAAQLNGPSSAFLLFFFGLTQVNC